MGRVELIIGCMFSGKSTELIRRIRRYKAIDKKILTINYSGDTRYGNNKIITHDNIKQDALFIDNLQCVLRRKDFLNAEIIAINEGQFFSDLYNIVITMADYYNKTVMICGLDGDYQRQPFGDILKLIPHAEDVLKLYSLCKLCNNGNVASFTKRLVSSDETIFIGGAESYIPVCRGCYNNEKSKEIVNNEVHL